MKKYSLGLFFFFCAIFCFGQENIDQYILYLEGPIPQEFQRVNDTTYIDNSGNIVLLVEDNLVKACNIGASFDTADESGEWLAFYYDYFKDNNWEYSNDSDIYMKNNVFAMIIKEQKRNDGKIASLILFTKDVFWIFGWALENIL